MTSLIIDDEVSLRVMIRIQALFRRFRTRRAFLQAKAVWTMFDDDDDDEEMEE